MSAQIIVTPSGERLVLLSEAEYEALLAAADDAEDRAAVQCFRRDVAAGREELVPRAVADRILAGENRIRVWRTYRGLTASELADQVGVTLQYIGKVEHEVSSAQSKILRKNCQRPGS